MIKNWLKKRRLKKGLARLDSICPERGTTDDPELVARADRAWKQLRRVAEYWGWDEYEYKAALALDPHRDILLVGNPPSGKCPLCGEPWAGIWQFWYPCRNSPHYRDEAAKERVEELAQRLRHEAWEEQERAKKKLKRLKKERLRRYLSGQTDEPPEDDDVPIAFTR